MPWAAAMDSTRLIRDLNPAASCCHSRLCRNTRTVFMPIPAVHPSSRSMVAGSKVSAWNISS